ncbi:phage distal tail protein [Paenibacillus pabuli]|nr:phage tail domain-containing protein [Paenibacillus pabuli]MEC0127492.1 phage tail family protein [Paenibacillus pabuli]
MSGEAQAQGDFTREYALEALPMSGEARISGDFIREINMRSEMSGEARMIAVASRYHVDYIEFEDVFNPGDQIVIDTDKFKITRNGQNVSHLYNGDFFYLNLGENNLTWTDPETGRTVLMRITHRDKFLY